MTAVRYSEIDGDPEYRIGTDGSVWTRKKKGPQSNQPGWRRRVTQKNPRTGYWRVGLHLHGTFRIWLVHRLVLEAFVGPCPPGWQALHGDGDKDNNDLSNLRWGTKKENAADTIRLGRQIHGETHHSATLTEEKVAAILQDLMNGEDQQVIAEKFGSSQTNISQIKRGTAWKHVPRPAGWPPLKRPVHGEAHPKAKLTRKDVEAILRDLAAGKSQQAIADAYSCCPMNISNIKRGVIWKEVPRPVS